jgi:hypothetical protein
VLAALALLLVLTAVPVFAQGVNNFTVGKANVVMFAPQTVWQGTNAHVVLKVTNNGTEPLSDFKAVLKLPEGQAKNIGYTYKNGKDGVDEIAFKNPVKPGETQYLSFTYINPKTAMPIGVHKATVDMSTGGQTQSATWNLDLREGTRYQASTGQIVVLILAVSFATMLGWFAYFKFVVNRQFKFFSNTLEMVVGIAIVALFFGVNIYQSMPK